MAKKFLALVFALAFPVNAFAESPFIMPSPPGGDMLRSIYDSDRDGDVDAIDYTILHAHEADPVVGAITGIVKANGAGVISAAGAGTDYAAATSDLTAAGDCASGACTGDQILDNEGLSPTGGTWDLTALTALYFKNAVTMGNGEATSTWTVNTNSVDPTVTWDNTGYATFSNGVGAAASAAPGLYIYDSDCLGTDKYIGGFRGEYISGLADHEATSLYGYALIDGTETEMFHTTGNDFYLVDDLSLLSDGAVLKFGADGDVTVTHVHNTGITTNLNFAAATYGSDGTVSNAELLYINTLTSNAMDLINSKQGTVTEGSLTDSVIVSADIKDAEVAAADMAAAVKGVNQEASLGNAGTLTPTAGYLDVFVELTCTADPSAIVIAETGAIDHAETHIKNVGSNTCTFADVATTFETLGGNTIILEAGETFNMEYEDDRWYVTSISSTTAYFNTIRAGVGVVTDADGINLTAAQMNGIVEMTGAGDVYIPENLCDTATGQWVTVKSTASHANSVGSADASDAFVLSNGTDCGNGDELDLAGAAGNQVTLICTRANKWVVYVEIGTCTDGGAD